MKRNPVVRDLIARPPRNAGKHKDKRDVMIEDLTNVRAELEQEYLELKVEATRLAEAMLPKADKDERRAELIADLHQLKALVIKLKRVQSELEEFDDEQ